MVVMKSLFHSQKLFLVLGFACVLVLALACAKSGEKAAPATPTAAPAPAAPTAPAVAPAPAKPLTQEEAIAKYAEGKPLVPGGPPFYPRQLLQTKGYQVHLKYHLTKLPLWEKAKYGGEVRGTNSVWASSFNVLDNLVLSRTIYAGMLLMIDMGRCTMIGREGKFDTCNGQYAKNYEVAIIPGIFQRWEQPDPSTYIFHVRKGVLWPPHPLMKRTDREVTAEDTAWYLNTVKTEGILKDNFNLVNSIEAVDRYTVRVKMQSPHVEFLRHMSNTAMGLIAKECYDDKDCRKGQTIVTPAPFLFVPEESVLRQKFVLQKNPEFYLKGLPYIDRMVGTSITDPASQKAAFLTGKIDQQYLTNPAEVDNMLKQRPDIWVHSSWVLAGSQVFRPQLKGPLADVRVRRAMAMTMDLPSVWEAGYGGHTTFVNLVSRDTFGPEWYYTLEQAGEYYQLNPARAKQLLTEAGYPNGFQISLVTSSTAGGWYDEQITVQANWKKHLNIDMKINQVDSTAYTAALYGRSWPNLLYQQGWNIAYWADQEGALIHMTKGQRLNLTEIDDPWISQQYLKQRGEFDPAKRAALLWEYEQYELQQIYFFRISVLTSFVTVQGWELNGASHEVTWFGIFNSPSWLSMLDTSKMPQR
jgi:peptide/nickel transport system substrate-binding protein